MYIKEILIGILILYILSTLVTIRIPSIKIIQYKVRDWLTKLSYSIKQPFLY